MKIEFEQIFYGKGVRDARPRKPSPRLRWLLLVLALCLPSQVWAQPVQQTSGPGFGTYSLGEVQIPLTASYGDGTYVWEVVAGSGSLPPGVSLRTDGADWFPTEARAGLIGVATTPGTYTFTLRVTSAGLSDDRICTLKISPLIVKDLFSLPDAFVSSPFSYAFTALNNAGPVTWSVPPWSNPLPPGVSLSSEGVLEGTPTASGFYSISISASDAPDNVVFRSVNLAVFDIQITTPGALPNATQGGAYFATLNATGGTGSYTFTSDSLPNGLVLNPAGTISGTVNQSPGLFGFNLTATDTEHVSYTKRMSIDVVGVPVVLPSLNLNLGGTNDCTIGVPCSRNANVNSGGTAPFTWTATGLPPGMSIRWGSGVTSPFVAPGNAEIWGTPTALGTYHVVVTVTDADDATATNTLSLFISKLLRRNNASNIGTINVPYSPPLRTMRVIGGNPPYTATLLRVRLPAGLTFDPVSLAVTGTPLENGFFGPLFQFTDSTGNVLDGFYTVSIGGGTSTIGISGDGDLGTRTRGASISDRLSACCAPSLVWSAPGGLPAGLSLSQSGLLTGAPTATGTHTFFVDAADGTNNANVGIRQFTMIVTPLGASGSSTLPDGFVNSDYAVNGVNLAPTITGATGALTWTLTPFNLLPPGLTLATNGLLSGKPTASGQYNFSLTVTDASVPTLIFRRSYRVFVYAEGTYPPLNLPIGSNLGTQTLGALSFQLTATGGLKPYHYALAPTATLVPGMRVQDGPPLPTNITASDSGGYVGVITAPNTYSTTIQVTDSQSPAKTFERSVTFSVTPLHVLSQVFNLPRATKGTPYSFRFTPYGGSGSYSWSGTNLPPGLTIDSSGQLSGTPTQAGIYCCSPSGPFVQLRDLADSSTAMSSGLAITVDPFAITTGGVLPDGTVGSAYNKPLEAPFCGTGCTWTRTSGSLPGGVSLSQAGVLSGTPTGTFNGFFTVQASGSNGTVQRVLSLRIMSNTPQPLFITNTSFSDTGFGGGPANALFAQGGIPPYEWAVDGDLPPGISLQDPGETLGANLGPGFSYLIGRAMEVGLSTFTLTVKDASNATASRTFTWRTTPFNFQYGTLPLAGTSLLLGQSYTQPLLVLGGTGIYTWASGPMPPGLSLDPNTGVVSGTPTNTGTFSVPIQVTDSAGDTMTQNVNFNIGPTVISFGAAANLGVANRGFLRTQNLSPSGGTPPYTITALTPLPPGFAIQTGDAVLSNGTPGQSYFLSGTPFASGTFTFTLRLQDSSGVPNVAVRTFTLVVASYSLFTSTTLPDASLGVPYSQQLVSWEESGPVSWSVSPSSALPAGLSLSSGGFLSGTPLQAGNMSFTLNGTDSSGAVISFSFSLRVSTIAITDPPILPQQVTIFQPFSYTFSASGGGPSKVWSVTGLPFGLTMSPTTGTVSGTITASGNPSQLIVTVTDGLSTFFKRFTLFTRAPNFALMNFPITATALQDTTVGQSTVFTLTPNGGTGPYTWSHVSGLMPPGMSLLSGSLFPQNFTPGSTLLAGAPTAAGLYTFDLIATDSVGAQIRRTFTLNVSAINILPSAPRNVRTGDAYSQRFTPVGCSPAHTFSMSPIGLIQDMLPPGLTLSPDGLISGTTTSTGNYNFFLRLDCAGQTFTRQYTLVVNSPAGLRVTSANTNWWVGGGRRPQTLTTSGSGSYTWSVVTPATFPPGAMLVAGSSPNTTLLAGQPTTPGTYSFTLRATEAGTGNTADHAFTIRVSPMQVVSAPQEFLAAGELPAGQVGSFYSYTYRVAGGTPPYSFAESPFAPLPPGLTLSSDGILSGTPEVAGTFTISPLVSDSAGSTLLVGPNTILTVTPVGVSMTLGPGAGTAIPDASRGVPYNLPLSPNNGFALIRGGVPPFAWSVASGSSLPPGIVILPGANGVPDHLGGIPSTPGNYSFSLTVTDSTMQSLTIPLQAKVSALALTPDAAPPGVVGAPYSVSLAASGGTPPYAIQLSPTLDMPPGLTLSSSGLLSGTPSDPGLFLVQVLLTDNAGSSLTKFYRIPIDNVAGEVPGFGLAPKPIQAYYVQTSPVPAPVTVSVNTTSGAVPFNLAVSGIPGAALSASNGTAPATVSLDLNLGSLAAGTYVGVLGATAPASANQFDSVPISVTVVPPPPCSFSLSPGESSAPATGATGSFDIVTGSLCSWTASTADTWITITSSTSGTGPASVSYSVALNPDASPRPGSISVGGQSFDITQFGSNCSFAISPQNLTVPASGGTAFISITASGSCPWSATGLGATPASGSGNGGVTVTIPPNGSPSSQFFTATIAEHTLNVLQTGIDCTVDITPHEAAWPSGGGTGSVTVTTPAGCDYDTVLGPSWIEVTGGGSGNGPGTLVYDVHSNTTTLPRSGDLTIGGQTFHVTQEGLPCSVTVDTSGLGSPYGPSGGAGTIAITTNGPNCTWTASSGAAWASIAPPSGTGNGAIGVSLTSNASSTTSRSTDLTIAGQTLTISQGGTTCTYALQSSTGAVPAFGGAGSVGVVAASVCSWTSASNDPGWLTITSSGTGGVGEVLFVAQANPDASPRSGTLTIAGLTYTVNQAGAPCSYTLDSAGTTIASAGVPSASFNFTTTATGCAPAALSYASWISITGTTFGGSSGTVSFSVGANPSAMTRSGTIQLGDRTFTVGQTGGQCGFSLNAYGAVFGKAGGSSSVLGSPSALGCSPDHGTDMPSFILLDSFSGPVLNIFTLQYTVLQFDSFTPAIRRGRISFGGQIFLVKQTSW